MEKKSIMVVADDWYSLKRTVSLLDQDRYEVFPADGGENAAELLELHDFDLVLTDLRMRMINGISLLEKIQLENPETRVIILTADDTLEMSEMAVRMGAYDYIKKPLHQPLLNTLLERALADKEPNLTMDEVLLSRVS